MTEPKKYRKVPVTIEAMQWDGTAASRRRIIDWILAGGGTARYREETVEPAGGVGYLQVEKVTPAHIAINTLEGTMAATRGDWIIKGVQGEFYPCKASIFAQTYEEDEELI